jgi:co-chaperonin GroES (HSP10)
VTATTQEILSVIRPAGYHLLVRLLPVEAKTKGGIVLTDAARQAEQLAMQMGQVIARGLTAYLDEEKFPSGPWCDEGDYIMMRSYSGTSFRIDGEEYRLINDDTVEAVIFAPDRVSRAL